MCSFILASYKFPMARLLRDPKELRVLLNWRDMPGNPAEAEKKDEVKAGELEKTKDLPLKPVKHPAKGANRKP